MSHGRRARPTASASMNTHQRTIATSAIPSPPQAASSPRDKTGKPGRPKNPRRELLVYYAENLAKGLPRFTPHLLKD